MGIYSKLALSYQLSVKIKLYSTASLSKFIERKGPLISFRKHSRCRNDTTNRPRHTDTTHTLT